LRPPEIAPGRIETVEEAAESLRAHYGRIHSLKAGGTVQYRLVNEEHWRPADFLLFLEKPDKLRMRAYRPLVSSLFELVSNGEQCWLYFPSDKTAYRSECDPVGASVNPALSAEVIVSAIVVVSDFDKFLLLPLSLSRGDELVRLSLDEGDLSRDLWLDPATGLVARQQVLSKEGALVADILYLEHAALSEAVIPSHLEIELPQMRSLIRLVIEEAQPDPEIPPDAFSLAVPQDVRILVPDIREWDSRIPTDSTN
jgi:outer membrane lipoprotein-sorting protein